MIARAFKALVHVVSLSCRLGRIDTLEADIVRLIKSLDNVTRNEISDGLFAVLDSVCVLMLLFLYEDRWMHFKDRMSRY